MVDRTAGDGSNRAMARFLLDQYLNAISPTNFARPTPKWSSGSKETGGANLVQGFLNLLEDVGSGKGIVQRRTDPNAFEKGKTIAATPGAVVFENELFQLIQYTPATDKVAAEPLLYVPPLVNRYYMIDLVPRQSLVKWLVDEGRTVFVISWVNPGPEHKDKDVGDYVSHGIVEAIGAGPQAHRQRARPLLLLPWRNVGRDRARLARGQGSRRRGQFRDADRRAGRLFRHARLVGIRPRSASRRARRAISRRRASPTASSCSGCSRRCAPTTSSGRRS